MSSSMRLQEAHVFVAMLMFAGCICFGQGACTMRVYQVCVIANPHGASKIKREIHMLPHLLKYLVCDLYARNRPGTSTLKIEGCIDTQYPPNLVAPLIKFTRWARPVEFGAGCRLPTTQSIFCSLQVNFHVVCAPPLRVHRRKTTAMHDHDYTPPWSMVIRPRPCMIMSNPPPGRLADGVLSALDIVGVLLVCCLYVVGVLSICGRYVVGNHAVGMIYCRNARPQAELHTLPACDPETTWWG